MASPTPTGCITSSMRSVAGSSSFIYRIPARWRVWRGNCPAVAAVSRQALRLRHQDQQYRPFAARNDRDRYSAVVCDHFTFYDDEQKLYPGLCFLLPDVRCCGGSSRGKKRGNQKAVFCLTVSVTFDWERTPKWEPFEETEAYLSRS